MKKWKCNPEVKKSIIDLVRYNFNRIKCESTVDGLSWYYGHAVGNLQTAYITNCMTWELFKKYHDVIYGLYDKKKKELTGRVTV